MKVWFVDDLPDNRLAWHHSFESALYQRHHFESFETVESLFAALEAQPWPDILFIDFYIGPRRGHEVIDYFQGAQQRPCLVAYSSQASANRAMLARGADTAFEKITGAQPNVELKRRLKSDADLLWLCQLNPASLTSQR